MKKIFRMMLLLTMMTAACVSMSSCSSDDNVEPEYVPVESAFQNFSRKSQYTICLTPKTTARGTLPSIATR